MSNASKPAAKAPRTPAQVPWNPWWGVTFVILVYFLSQLLGGVVVSIYPGLHHWSQTQAQDWLNNSIAAQFVFVLLAEGLALAAVYWFLKKQHTTWRSIGLRRPRASDVGYGLLAFPVYFVLFAIITGVISYFVPHLNVNQQQDIGFTGAHGFDLVLTFISLVIIPPVTEEVMMRGVLYGSLKKALPLIWAVLITSALFASAHLSEGGSGGPLYIAAIDTFILSLVLIYLREKTAGLWACMTLHALKNGIAFAALFLYHVR